MSVLKDLLKKDKKEEKKEVKKTSSKSVAIYAKKINKAKNIQIRKNAGDILLSPRITEKATYLAEENTYVFNISPRATKKDVKGAIFDVYNINPLKVNIIKIPSKKVFRRGKKGVKSGGKKALVYLKKGDKIEFV